MADVKRCDRCKRVYDRPKAPELWLLSKRNDEGRLVQFDLCPDCMAEAGAWASATED